MGLENIKQLRCGSVFGSQDENNYLGSIGDIGAFSFFQVNLRWHWRWRLHTTNNFQIYKKIKMSNHGQSETMNMRLLR